MAGKTEEALNIRKELLNQLAPKDKPLSCVEKLMKAGKSRTEADSLCTEHEYNTERMKKADKSIFRSK